MCLRVSECVESVSEAVEMTRETVEGSGMILNEPDMRL